MRVLKKIGSIFGWLIVILILLINIINAIDRSTNYGCSFFGLRGSVIVSNSMSYVNDSNKDYLENTDTARIYKNDLIFTFDVKSYDEIKVLDVITYVSNGGLICHRVVDKYEDNGKQYIVTRGDANNVDDLPIEFSLVRGKLIGVLPGVGIIFLFTQSLYGLLALFICLFFIFLGMYIFNKDNTLELEIEKKKMHKNKEQKIYIIKANKNKFKEIFNEELNKTNK